jgi:two-component system, OmpR family, phosphate regulon response regulator PhoB
VFVTAQNLALSAPHPGARSSMRAWKVLVIHDEADRAGVATRELVNEGYAVEVAATAERGLARLAESSPDIVLLDLVLPDLHGDELFQKIRGARGGRQPAIIVITASADESARLLGTAAVDDYIVKPFSARELSLRVGVVAGRLQRTPARSERQPARRILTVGPLTIDLAAYRTYVRGREVQMSEMERRFLVFLVERRGSICSRDELLRSVWQYRSGVSSRTLDTHAKRLRDKLGVAAVLVETVRGVGYRLSDRYAVTDLE